MQNGSEIIRTEEVGVSLSSTPGVQELEGVCEISRSFSRRRTVRCPLDRLLISPEPMAKRKISGPIVSRNPSINPAAIDFTLPDLL